MSILLAKRAAFFSLTTLAALGGAAAGCTAEAPSEADAEAVDVQAMSGPAIVVPREFGKAIPKGNGRACATCHVPEKNFTISPAQVEARFQADPYDPLFRSIDADDFDQDFTTVRTKALFRVTLTLPPNVKLADDPAATTVQVWRAVPTVFNTKLTAPYTVDLRAPTLFEQAKGAAAEHSRPTSLPGDPFFATIAAFEASVFSSPKLKDIAEDIDEGKAPPPVGEDVDDGSLSDLEKEGLAVFQSHCVVCHDGTARNQLNPFLFPTGATTILISEFNRAGLATHAYDVTENGVTTRTPPTPDPGHMLVTGKQSDLNAFDATGLRGVSKTAPYFHDNSAATLVDVINHYNLLFPLVGLPLIPPEQFVPLIAYLDRL